MCTQLADGQERLFRAFPLTHSLPDQATKQGPNIADQPNHRRWPAFAVGGGLDTYAGWFPNHAHVVYVLVDEIAKRRRADGVFADGPLPFVRTRYPPEASVLIVAIPCALFRRKGQAGWDWGVFLRDLRISRTRAPGLALVVVAPGSGGFIGDCIGGAFFQQDNFSVFSEWKNPLPSHQQNENNCDRRGGHLCRNRHKPVMSP